MENIVLNNILGKLGKSPTDLTDKIVKNIHKTFPVPKEYNILWADLEMELKLTGIVLTNQAIFLKGNKIQKDKKNIVFHFIKWEDFNLDFFSFENGKLKYCEQTIFLKLSNKTQLFFDEYRKELKRLTHPLHSHLSVSETNGQFSQLSIENQTQKISERNQVNSPFNFLVFSGPAINLVFSKRVAQAKFNKKMLSLVGTVTGGSGGAIAASLIVAKIGVKVGTVMKPGLGTVIGLSGGLVGGFAAGMIMKSVGDKSYEDPTVVLSRMFNAILLNLVYEYRFQENEIEILINQLDTIKEKEFKKLFKKVQDSTEQVNLIESFVRPYFEAVINNRPLTYEES